MPDDGPTYCVNCEHMMKLGKSDPPWRWLCRQHKSLDGYGFVTPTTWDNADPYLLCRNVNGGVCPLHSPIKEGASK